MLTSTLLMQLKCESINFAMFFRACLHFVMQTTVNFESSDFKSTNFYNFNLHLIILSREMTIIVLTMTMRKEVRVSVN